MAIPDSGVCYQYLVAPAPYLRHSYTLRRTPEGMTATSAYFHATLPYRVTEVWVAFSSHGVATTNREMFGTIVKSFSKTTSNEHRCYHQCCSRQVSHIVRRAAQISLVLPCHVACAGSRSRSCSGSHALEHCLLNLVYEGHAASSYD